jgi:hypothetical protein
MSMGYKVNVNDTFHFDMETESVSHLDIVSIATDKFHILNENIPYQAEIITSDFLQKLYRQGKQQHLHRCHFKPFGYFD